MAKELLDKREIVRNAAGVAGRQNIHSVTVV
jgi:hypothetical protein